MFMGFGFILILLVIGLVVFVIGWLFLVAENRNERKIPGSQSAIEILEQRFVRGEIGKPEFEEIREELRKN
jgi:uncharacterized membrane protein